MIKLFICLSNFGCPYAYGDGDYRGVFLGDTDNFLRKHNVHTLTASTRKFKDCKAAKILHSNYSLTTYQTSEETFSNVDLCNSSLARLFGKIPKTIYYKIN